MNGFVQGGVYQVLSPEPLGPRQSRIDLKQPENSLLLTKSTMESPPRREASG